MNAGITKISFVNTSWMEKCQSAVVYALGGAGELRMHNTGCMWLSETGKNGVETWSTRAPRAFGILNH